MGMTGKVLLNTRPADLQGEAFDFATPVVIDGAVEVWMSAVEKEMRNTLHRSAA